jgi:mannosyltransferase
VTTVHDLIYEKFCKGIGATVHLRQKEVALRKSNCIVCVSENTRKDLFEHYPFCIDKKVVVISNGVDSFFKSEETSQLISKIGLNNTSSYFLYVGNRGGCKGFSVTYDALDFLQGSLPCLVVGDPFTTNELSEIRARGHENNIFNLGKVSDIELNNLYSKASFFFFPSLYEGFGIPPLEAMMAGCPVLASNCSSVPEVVGDAGILFDPIDLASLRNGLSRIMQTDVKLELISLGLKRSSSFNWNSVIDAYSALYSELLA